MCVTDSWQARSCSLSSLVSPFTPFLLKKRLLDFTVNAHQPVLRSSGTLTKVIGLGLKLVRSLLSITQLNRKLACEVHGSRAIFIGTLGGFVQQSKDAISSIIRRYIVAQGALM